MYHITDFVVSSRSLPPLFSLWLVKFCSTMICQEHTVLNQQASSLSSQSQISQNGSDFLQCFCSPSTVWCPVCCPMSIVPCSHPVLKACCMPSLLPFYGFHWVNSQLTWASALIIITLAEVSQYEHGIWLPIAKYFNLRENVKVTPKYTAGNLYFLHYYEY